MDEEKEALLQQIVVARKNLRDLESKFRRSVRTRFHHKCPFCRAEWEGTKEIIRECNYCKRMLVEWVMDPETKERTLVRIVEK